MIKKRIVFIIRSLTANSYVWSLRIQCQKSTKLNALLFLQFHGEEGKFYNFLKNNTILRNSIIKKQYEWKQECRKLLRFRVKQNFECACQSRTRYIFLLVNILFPSITKIVTSLFDCSCFTKRRQQYIKSCMGRSIETSTNVLESRKWGKGILVERKQPLFELLLAIELLASKPPTDWIPILV